MGVGQKCCLADFGATHTILPRSSRLWTQPKSSRPHAQGLEFGPRLTHAILRGSRIVRKCRGRADLGRGRYFFDPRNVAWVEQNMAPARFGPTLGPGQVWPRTDFEGALQNGFWPSLAHCGSICNSEAWVLHGFSVRIFCFFQAQGRIFEPGIRFGDLESTLWPGQLFGVKHGSRKK